MRRSAALGAGLVLSLGALTPSAMASPAVPASASTVSASTLSSHLPADWHSRAAAAASRFGIESPARGAVARAIDPTDYQCGPTDFDTYIDGLLSGLSTDELGFLFQIMDIPTYDALVFGTTGDPQFALRADATQISHTFRDARRFWDIQSADIQLMAMHGDTLTDPARVTRVLNVVYGMSQASSASLAAYIVKWVASVPQLQNGQNPIFTLNAFAFSGKGDPDPFVSSIPDKLIFGDGIIDALNWMGIGDVGPRAVLGHEFGHHVQYEDNLFDSPLTGAEATRRTELMADAFGTYFVTHKRGLALNTQRVLQAEKTFYEVGDCAFTDPGHHGTPNQRVRASQWGAQLAQAAQKQGQILPSLTVAAAFDRALPQIVAPDAR